MAELLLGLPVAQSINQELLGRVASLKEADIVPKLAIVRVGAREDDLSYERGALKRCEALGIETEILHFEEGDVDTQALISQIKQLNARRDVHGVLMFRPLPAHIDQAAVCEVLDPAKDVDCLTSGSLFGVLAGVSRGFAPCTAEAVLALLDFYGIALDGAEVAVIGKPVAALLCSRNATVTTCHTHTADLAAVCRDCDVIVAAAGHAKTVGLDCARDGQTIIDVGINWDEENQRLVGDVDFDAVEPVVSKISPVPRGVGSVTTAVLAKHVVEAAERTQA